MYIFSVIPIHKGIPFNTLSYFSSEQAPVGSLLSIPFGRQTIYGLLYQSETLLEAKADIKQSKFALKKVKEVVGYSPFLKGVAEGLLQASIRTLVPIGAIAGATLHELFFDMFQNFEEFSLSQERESLVSYGTTLTRLDEYKRIIRSSFAEKKSVVLVAPSIRTAEFWYNNLKKGITAHSVLIHSKCTKKNQKLALTELKQSKRPLFICVTPAFALIPRKDITSLIIEDESSSLYKTQDRYEIDMRVVLVSIAKACGWRVVYGDTFPRFETMVEANKNLSRSFTPERLVVVPTDQYRTLLPTEAIELVRYAQKNKKSVFLYTNRKGIAPLSRCADCGFVVSCPSCELPMVLRYKRNELGERERFFVCTSCGDTRPPDHVCSYCNSWNITPVPIGTESLREAVSVIVDKEKILVIDDDLTPDAKVVESLIESAQKQKFFVMIGTQKILPFIKGIDFSIIPFFDRILSTPSPYTVEEALRLVMKLNECTRDSLVVCTKNPDFPIIKQFSTKKIQSIFDEDIELRKTLHYPPFGTLLKLSISVQPSQQDFISKRVELFFEGYEKNTLPKRRISPDSMKLLCVWIIQVNADFLEDMHQELTLFLNDLKTPYKIEVNPLRFS